jgi:hypothetical protein
MYDPAMTKPHPFPSPPRLRPDSARALNQLRLLWLLGWTGADIAAHFGVNRTTIWRRLKTHGLRGPEQPEERERLAEAEARAMLTDALMRGDERAAKEVAGLLPKMTGPARAKPAPAETPNNENGTYTDEDRDEFIAEIERLAAMESGLAQVGAAGDQSEGLGRKQQGADGADPAPSLSGACPPYASSAAGPSAHMVAFGGTWRGQDAGRGGMGAVGGAAGGLPEGSAGGAELQRCARSDDRGAERPDLDLG